MRSLLDADAEGATTFHVYGHRDSASLLQDRPRCTVHPIFTRKGRRWQLWRLLRRLIPGRDRVLLGTARNTDLLIACLSAQTRIVEPGRVFSYVHWYRPSPVGMRLLRYVARRHPGIEIVCPTDSVSTVFGGAGFENVHIRRYPRTAQWIVAEAIADAPATILFAGAARVDKGFHVAVDLVELLHHEQSSLPVTIQCSTTHWGELQASVRTQIERLRTIDYPHLTLVEDTLDQDAYQSMTAGTLTIQPYDAAEFTDRISGVTLDALMGGSPLIVPAHTWMARQVERFDAGVIVEDGQSCDQILAAVDAVLADWHRYAANAAAGGWQLSAEHDARKLLELLLNGNDN